MYTRFIKVSKYGICLIRPTTATSTLDDLQRAGAAVLLADVFLSVEDVEKMKRATKEKDDKYAELRRRIMAEGWWVKDETIPLCVGICGGIPASAKAQLKKLGISGAAADQLLRNARKVAIRGAHDILKESRKLEASNDLRHISR